MARKTPQEMFEEYKASLAAAPVADSVPKIKGTPGSEVNLFAYPVLCRDCTLQVGELEVAASELAATDVRIVGSVLCERCSMSEAKRWADEQRNK